MEHINQQLLHLCTLLLMSAAFVGAQKTVINPSDDFPKACLAELRRKSPLQQGTCDSQSFMEIEFKLQFGSGEAAPTHIDQGIRFEVNSGGWRQVLFIAPSLDEPGNSIVRLLSNDTIEADALLYTAPFPLRVVNSSEPIVVRSFLCDEYIARFKQNRPFRIRWMQRYTTEPGAGRATWSLDDIKIRVWQGDCLKKVHYNDFGLESIQNDLPPGIRYQLLSGAFCPSDFKLCFNDFPFGDAGSFRRSLIITLENQDFLTCEPVEEVHDSDVEGLCSSMDQLPHLSLPCFNASAVAANQAENCPGLFSGAQEASNISVTESTTDVMTTEDITTPTTNEQTTESETTLTADVPTTEEPTTEEPTTEEPTTEEPTTKEPTTEEPTTEEPTTEEPTTEEHTTEEPTTEEPTTEEPTTEEPTTEEPTTEEPTTEEPTTETEEPTTEEPTTEVPTTEAQTTPTTETVPKTEAETTPTMENLPTDPANVTLVNDTASGDPVMTVPILVSESQLQSISAKKLSLCYEVHGESNRWFNLVSDKCASVNAHYAGFGDLNVIDTIAVRSVNTRQQCVNISVSVANSCSAVVNGVETRRYSSGGVSVRSFGNRVRIAVPNCNELTLVMWVFCEKLELQSNLVAQGFPIVDNIKFVVMRGLNHGHQLAHGLIGQFWNIPVSVTPFNGRTIFGDRMRNSYVVNVSDRRYVGVLARRTWELEEGPCLYVGNGQAGAIAEVDNPGDGVIEGEYRDYIVSNGFLDDFKFGQFNAGICT